MFIAACLIILLLSLSLLFIALMTWLAHTIEGYPAFVISHANRDAVQPLFVPNGSAILDALAKDRARREHWTASSASPRAQLSNKRNKTAAI